MQTTFRDQAVRHRACGNDTLRHAQRSDPCAAHGADRDQQFVSLLQGFRPSGGLSRAHSVAEWLASRCGQNVGTLARWMVRGEVLHFEWQSDSWLPMFQFHTTATTPHSVVGLVLKELEGVFDPWETAQWFARPSIALGGRMPADAVASDADAVLQVARFDRYLADA